jgi:methylmalonyl-CoA/ethylmalonyl-CoA epimerase
MVIDHIGIVVNNLESGIDHWRSVFGYEQMTEIVINTRQKVKVAFLCKKNSIDIKLVEPTDKLSPVFEYAQKGGGLHHLCFRCDDLNSQLQQLKVLGLRVIADAQPGEAFENERIAFVYARNGLNIELIETCKRARRLI